ncbi:MAG: ATPase, partial [Frankiales bacterium]|nr:ATPase [Frankiales bacterium]
LAAAEGGRLRGGALVDVERDGPWAGREVSACSALVWALCGDGSLDPDLPPGVVVLPGRGAPVRGSLHLVSGSDRESRRTAGGGALGGLGLLVTAAPTTRAEWDAVVREATVAGLSVLVEVETEVPPGLDGVLRRAPHVTWGLSSPAELPLDALPDVPRRDLLVEDGTATEDEWRALTGGPPPDGVRLDRRQLQLVALADAAPTEAVRRLAGGHLERLATRVRARRGWDDLVLPAPLQAQARGLLARHRQRQLVYDAWGFPGLPSRGTVALFAGPSGSGKTLTAEVVAGELGLDLFVLDLSSIMSKYIGETEKNLGALFDAAAAGDVVLFFDEADALFGKRSAVSDAKDRYANVEVAYLLQRLEKHDGLVLLATNLPNNIDDAFVRRLHATLEFTAPGPVERRGIWERAFPPACPTTDVDLDLLAREADLSGGAIATAAVTAAFAAAAAGEPVTMAAVVAAVSAEYRKQGRLSVPAALADRGGPGVSR